MNGIIFQIDFYIDSDSSGAFVLPEFIPNNSYYPKHAEILYKKWAQHVHIEGK